MSFAGPQGDPGISGLEVVSASDFWYDPGSSLAVECPAGKYALGGGSELVPSSLGSGNIDASMPSGNPATGWAIRGRSSGKFGAMVTVYAVCAYAAP